MENRQFFGSFQISMGHTVQISGSGHRFTAEADETILDAALRHGISLPYGCRNGACGSCRATLVSGRVHYDEGGDGLPPALSPQEAETGQVILCQAIADSDLVIKTRELTSGQEIEIKTLPCRIEDRRRLAHDVMLLLLKLPDNNRLQFMAGQYVDILLQDGRRRSFSIANAPHDDELIEMHIRHVEGGEFTDYVFDQMPEKALLRISGPLGSFYLREDSTRPIILIGGGTGFAPLKGIIEHALHIGDTRPMHLFWGVRAQRDLYMDELPRRWVEEYDHIHYTPVLSEPDSAQGWDGATGFVTDVALNRHPDIRVFDVYMAGPPVMTSAGRKAFLAAGLSEDHLFYDAFEFSNDKKKKPA